MERGHPARQHAHRAQPERGLFALRRSGGQDVRDPNCAPHPQKSNEIQSIMIRKLFNLVLVVALSVTATIAQRPTSTTASPDRLRQVITYLASDALEGRRTGTPGAYDAAQYITGEFNRYGLQPGMQIARPARTRRENQARYLQPFPYVAGVELGKNNLFFVNPGRADDIAQFRVGEDWMPLGFSSNASVKRSELVFAGYGISSAELKYDDYSVSNVKDRVAIVFAGTPDGDNPHGQFARAGEIRFKVAAARAAGARALLIITSEEKLSDDRLSRLSYDNAGEAGIPVIVISRQLAKKLLYLPNPEMTLAELEKICRRRSAGKCKAGTKAHRKSGRFAPQPKDYAGSKKVVRTACGSGRLISARAIRP